MPASLHRPVVATLLPFPLSQPGGVSTFVIGLSRAMKVGFGTELRLLSPNHFRGGPGRRISQVVLGIQQFVSLCRARPDVVHTHQHPALLAAALAYRAVRLGRVRVVHTVHVDPAEPTVFWKRVVLGWLLAQSGAVTTVSEQTARSMGRVATPPPRAVHVIRGATGILPRAPDDPAVMRFRRALGLDEFRPIICQISPLNFPLKVAGVQRLVQSFALIRQHFPDARLLIVGDGVLRPSVEAAADLAGVADGLFLTGYLDDVSIPLALADVCCHISLQDACPLSVLEAMRCGKPIVAARAGGIPELISDGYDGLLVDPLPSEIAKAVIRVLDDPSFAAELGQHAAATAVRRFGWDRTAAEFAPLYGLQGGTGAEEPTEVLPAPRAIPIQRLQELVYKADFDYRRGSPHLTHVSLYNQLLDQLRGTLARLSQRQLPGTVLELGAGHGGFTEPMLAWGYHVTATEMSRPSVSYLNQRYGRNRNFAATYDPDGSLSILSSARFSAIVSVSVLHHIPDYRQAINNAITNHLQEGGTFVALQDPMWYPTLSPAVRLLGNVSYVSWRLFQGRYVEGLHTGYRRLRRTYDEMNTADTVEYHVVRQGVDHQAIIADLDAQFEQCSLLTYWSSQSGFWQKVGEMVGLQNTFGVIASGYRRASINSR